MGHEAARFGAGAPVEAAGEPLPYVADHRGIAPVNP
jgi:hypothetical protein